MIMLGCISTEIGLWPAFWTLGVNGSWPSNGEIDIMEYYRNKLLANIAYGTSTPFRAKWYSTAKALDSFTDLIGAKNFTSGGWTGMKLLSVYLWMIYF